MQTASLHLSAESKNGSRAVSRKWLPRAQSSQEVLANLLTWTPGSKWPLVTIIRPTWVPAKKWLMQFVSMLSFHLNYQDRTPRYPAPFTTRYAYTVLGHEGPVLPGLTAATILLRTWPPRNRRRGCCWRFSRSSRTLAFCTHSHS